LHLSPSRRQLAAWRTVVDAENVLALHRNLHVSARSV
jgi:hypothetical protein